MKGSSGSDPFFPDLDREVIIATMMLAAAAITAPITVAVDASIIPSVAKLTAKHYHIGHLAQRREGA
jgi:hypothetical protein